MYVDAYIVLSIIQALLYQKYSVMSDIWSYGCVLFEIWSMGSKPFENSSGAEVSGYSYDLSCSYITYVNNIT